MSPHKSLFDLTDETLLAGTWQIDGQAVAGIELLNRGVDAIEHLSVLADNGKTYTIKGHANLMEDEGEHAWAGWVMELDQRRQVYLQIVAKGAIVPASDPTLATPLSPGPDTIEIGAGVDLNALEEEGAYKMAPTTPTLDDMLLVTFTDDGAGSSSPGAVNANTNERGERARKERWRMSQKHFDVFLMTWPLVFFVVFIFFLVSLCVATEAEPLGRLPWLTWVTFGMIGAGYLGMWYGPKEMPAQNAV